MGQIILHTGIPATDPFSYTMPTFPFVDHEWLSNIFIFFSQNVFSLTALATFYAFLAISSLLIAIRKSSGFFLFFTLGASAIIPLSGIRTQVESWVLLSLLIFLLDKDKLKWFIPFLLLLWANLHGSFPLALVVMGFYFLGKSLRLNKIFWEDTLLFLVSVGVTFINPYGGRLWGEIWNQISDTGLHTHIAEWVPTIFSFPLGWSIYTAHSVALVIYFRKKIKLEYHFLYWSLFLIGLTAIRNVPIFVIGSLPITLLAFSFFRDKAKPKYFTIAYGICCIFALLVGLVVTWQDFMQYKNLSEGKFYPQKAVSYLNSHLPSGNIMSTYSWGGYLDWKMPNKKVFIDGRMPSWRRNNTSTHESTDAFIEEEKIFSAEIPLKKALHKYDISTLLLPKSIPSTPKESPLLLSFAKILGITPPSSHKFLGELGQNGFRIVYQDKVAIIYQR